MPPVVTVDTWLTNQEPRLRKIAVALRIMIFQSEGGLTETIKWGNPVYETNGPVCYLATGRGYVSLGFFQGANLTDPEGRIEGTGKRMRHVKVRTVEDARDEKLPAWVREAANLNQSK